MRRVRIVLIALPVILAAFVLTSSAALAASPHFKKGGEPTCTFSGTTSIPVSCTGTLAGLGNQDLNIHLAVSAFALYQCQNGGGNTAPGQNKVLEGPATSDTAIPASAIKNGNLVFATNPATLTPPAKSRAATGGWPKCNLTRVNPGLTLTEIPLEIFQPVTTQIF